MLLETYLFTVLFSFFGFLFSLYFDYNNKEGIEQYLSIADLIIGLISCCIPILNVFIMFDRLSTYVNEKLLNKLLLKEINVTKIINYFKQ